MKNVQIPCAACPWRRDSKPGGLGSKEPTETFIGQVYGPFYLPCHCGYPRDGSDPDWKEKALKAPQCAGAAIFRANIGVSRHLPEQLHRLPADPAKVFETAEEFTAHHKKCSLDHASDLLALTTPQELLRQQISRKSNVWRQSVSV